MALANNTGALRAVKRLFVGNLPWTIGNKELLTYFSQFGHVNQAKVIFDRKTGFTRGYGFVQFSNRTGFESATKQNTHDLEGNQLTVQPATS